ncbi:MAG: hypothetical protein AAB296_10600, partial [Candidatus Desantisbacteria bacterium]
MSERQLKTMLKIINLANSPLSLGGKLKEMANLISLEFGVENCRIYIVDANGMTLSLKVINDCG